jgi:RNA polymerase sigma-54 factor
MAGLSQSQTLSQQQVLAPQLQQSLQILQAPMLELRNLIQQELCTNPTLEEDQMEPTIEDKKAEHDEFQEEFDRLAKLDEEWRDYMSQSQSYSGRSAEEEERRQFFFDSIVGQETLQQHLLEQVNSSDMSAGDRKIAELIIGNIDDAGFLQTGPEEIAQNTGMDMADLSRVLEVVHTFHPIGVGARDLRECLLLQLTPETPHRDVLRVLIQNHLEDIAHNRLPAIQRRTGFDLAVIKEAIEVLRHLNRRPGEQFTSESIPYVVPDILVERTEDGEYTVRLLDDWLPNIYISRRYVDLYREKGSDPKTREYLKRKIQAAQWLQESIEQRRSTLEKVTRAIIQHQRAFLDKGPEHIEPLKMQQIADQVGVHVTTVSRAVDDKWVQTPRGIFSLKRFFGGGTQTASGEEVAWETIKQKLLEIIGQEDKSNPLSDEDLVTKLHEAGYPVARRTVTKYRKMADIPSSRQRKDWTA